MKKHKAPPVDIRKVIRAAAEAALEEPVAARPKRHRLSAGRAVMLGAGLVTAGRLMAGGRISGLLNSVQDRVAGLGVDLAGNAPVGPELDDDELEDELDVTDGLETESDGEPEDAGGEDLEDEGPVDEEQSNGGAPERKARRQSRGR